MDAEGLLRLAQAGQRLIAHQEAEFLARLRLQYFSTPDRPLIDDNELAGLPKPAP